MIRTKEIIKILIPLLIIATTLSTYNNTVNTHYHYNADGVLIEHSHPYNNEGHSPMSPTHTHSENELKLLQLIKYNSIGFLIALVFVLLLKIVSAAKLIFKLENFYLLHFQTQIIVRGPPVS